MEIFVKDGSRGAGGGVGDVVVGVRVVYAVVEDVAVLAVHDHGGVAVGAVALFVPGGRRVSLAGLISTRYGELL